MRRTVAAAAATRRQILAAGLIEFAERGFDGATFERVAGRVGVTRGAVHHHFPAGKEELLQAVLADEWERYADRALEPLRRVGTDGPSRLAAFLAAYLDLVCDDPTFRGLVTVTTLVAPRAPSTARGIQNHRHSLDEWRAAVRAVLEEPGVLAEGTQARAALFAIITVLVGINNTAALEPEQLPATADQRQAVVRAVLRGLVRSPLPTASATDVRRTEERRS
jgi:AcrR family transcriptional regulator